MQDAEGCHGCRMQRGVMDAGCRGVSCVGCRGVSCVQGVEGCRGCRV